MALDDKSILNNKLSPLIEGQVPDFVQSDHPIFVEFLKDYYKFLEAGELTISTTTDYVVLETASPSYVLDEDDGDRIVTEIGAGTTGYFIENETITGETSNAAAQVLVDNSRNSKLFVTSQQKFITGELITGGTSGSTGTVVEYRGNPVQNIQQMLDYADVDNTIYDFLDKMKDSFMTDIPSDLASGVSQRDLLKNIKDLYAAKGTSEGHKLFMRMLLGETADIFYPNQYMMKASSGRWEGETVLRVLAFSNVTGEEVVNQIITGETSGATATVVSSLVSQQTKDEFNDSVTEFEIANITGTFDDSEIVSAVSSTSNRLVKFTVFGIISEINIENRRGGTLYSKDEVVDLEILGNDFAEVVVDEVLLGRVGSVIVDDSGTDYAVGDVVTFTSNAVDSKAEPATGAVAMVGGGIEQETATVAFYESTTDSNSIVMESGTRSTEISFNIILEEVKEDRIVSNGTSTTYAIGSNINTDTDEILVFLNDVSIPATTFKTSRDIAFTNWTTSGTNITFNAVLLAGIKITIRQAQVNHIILDRTDIVGGVTGTGTTAVGGSDSGYKIETNDTIGIPDLVDQFTRNKIVLEYDTFENLGVTSERGSIQSIRVDVKEKINAGYSKLPTLSITSVGGSGAAVFATPHDIGKIQSVKINNNGFRYSNTNPPDVNFRAHFLLKDVTGTFGANNSLTSHVGTVIAWDTTTNELILKEFDNTQKIVQEQTGTFNEGIQLELGTELLTPVGFLLEDEQELIPTGFIKKTPTELRHSIVETVTEDRIVMDSTDIIDPYEVQSNPFSFQFSGFGIANDRVTIKVTAEWNEASSAWAFYLDGKSQKNFVMYEGTEYYFDLSHPSLYGLQKGQPVRFLQKSFALSLTQDGRNADGTAAARFTNISDAKIVLTTQNYNVDGLVDIIPIGIGNNDTTSWAPKRNSPMAIVMQEGELAPSYIWDSSKYSLATPPSPFELFTPQGLADRNLFAADEIWNADDIYAIQQGYTGAYLKITIPLGSAPAGGKYYYYSPNFDAMGGVITVKRKAKTIIGAGDSIRFNALDKEEYGLILENGSQDRTIAEGEGDKATDQLIMEDGRDYIDATEKVNFEKSILTNRPQGPTDAQFLSLWYRSQSLNATDTYEGYQNFINQNYEPTYFMDESYMPPIDFWDWCGTGGEWHNFEKGIRTTPPAKDMIRPVQKQLIPLAREASAILYGNGLPLRRFSPPVPYFFPKTVANENGFLLIDNLRERNVGFIVLDGTDADGSDAGSLVANEDFGNTLILDATDASSSDARDGFLLDDETGDGNIILDATASGVDIGDELVLEETLVFADGITITDSSGASGTVAYINKAQGASSVSAISEKTASYRGINNIIGEDLIRLQDSYYYQDYSYEVVVGQSLLTYFDELKKAVHPAGFRPFGKVSIATLVSAAVTNTAAGVSGYEGDTKTFSPILGSVLETIFSQVLQSRLQVPSTITADGQVPIGSRDDRIVQETGVLPGENLILDASAASTDVGSNLLFEDGDGLDLENGLTTAGDGAFLYEVSAITYTDDITSGTGDGGGRIMAETSHASSGNSDRSLVTQKFIKIESRPLPRFERNILLYLAESPFGAEPCGITLETGSGNLVDNILMDGEIPFAEGNSFMELERDSEIDNIILDGTDALGTNAGEGLILETGFFLKIEDPSLGRESETFAILFEDDGKLQLEGSRYAFSTGYHVSDGNKLLLDTLDNDETIPLSDISSLTFEQIRTVEKFEIQGLTPDEENWGGGADDDNITMEDFGQILLDRTTDEGANAGFHLLQETSKRNRFTLEQSGTLIVEDFSTLSNVSALTLEADVEAGDIVLENIFDGLIEAFNIKLEDDVNLQGVIVLDGTDSIASNAGDKLDLEEFFDGAPTDHKILLEEHRVFTNEGQIPAANYRLNSTKVITKGNVRSAEVSVRDTGDIALEDSTDDTHGYLVLNSTSGSSTNAGENFDLEGATGITY